MVEVFKTDINTPTEARFIKSFLQQLFTGAIIHFDLEDRDKILRMEDQAGINDQIVTGNLSRLGFRCEVLSELD